ncbi:MAG TPA: hypothetical protein VNW54_04945 [Granulicella sp.]|jgi:hypothetical protein|nr:hypothetical protein [Granulicella sp.]
MAVSLAPEKDRFPVGQKPRVFLAIKNLTELRFEVSTDNPMRVCVKGKDGDPPETDYQRHLHGDFRAGDGPDLLPGPVVRNAILPWYPTILKIDLSAYYDLSVPGTYTVYTEFMDQTRSRVGEGSWIRTNTAKFEIQGPAR